MRSGRLLASSLAVVGLLAACGSDSEPASDAIDASSPAGGSGAGSTEPVAQAALVADAPSALPGGFTPTESATLAGVQVVVGSAAPAGTSVAAAAVRTDGEWQTVTIDDGSGYSAAGGLALLYGWSATSVAAGPQGFVATGYAGLYSGNINQGTATLLWFSADGVTWTRIDPRSVVGGASPWFQLSHVRATSAGFVALGTNGQNQSIVLTSADGTTWAQTDSFTVPWSLLPVGLYTDGNLVVAEVEEYLCLTDPFAVGTQPLLRWSADGGATWSAVDMSAVPTLDNYVPEPDAATCATPEYSGLDDLSKLAGTHGPIGVVGGQLLMVDSGLTRVAISTDGATWATAELPGPTPVSGSDSFSFTSRPSLVTTVGGSTAIFVQVPPEYGQAPTAMVGWTSTDGTSWTSVSGLDITPTSSTVIIDASADGAVVITYPLDNQDTISGPATLTAVRIA